MTSGQVKWDPVPGNAPRPNIAETQDMKIQNMQVIFIQAKKNPIKSLTESWFIFWFWITQSCASHKPSSRYKIRRKKSLQLIEYLCFV